MNPATREFHAPYRIRKAAILLLAFALTACVSQEEQAANDQLKTEIQTARLGYLGCRNTDFVKENECDRNGPEKIDPLLARNSLLQELALYKNALAEKVRAHKMTGSEARYLLSQHVNEQKLRVLQIAAVNSGNATVPGFYSNRTNTAGHVCTHSDVVIGCGMR